MALLKNNSWFEDVQKNNFLNEKIVKVTCQYHLNEKVSDFETLITYSKIKLFDNANK